MKNLSITAPTAFHFICSSVCLTPPTPIGISLLSTLSIRSSIERRVTRIRDRDCPTSNTAVLFCLDPAPEAAVVSVEMAPQAPEVAPEPFPLELLATIVSLSSPVGNLSNKKAFQLKTKKITFLRKFNAGISAVLRQLVKDKFDKFVDCDL